MEQKSASYYNEITADHKWYDLKLKEVWQYRDLIILFTKRNFQVTYKQTILGPAWLFINPLISSLIYCFIFGRIAGMGTNGVPQLLFYLSGNAIWTFFSTSATKNASTFTENANVFGKVYFPRLTIPISNTISAVVTFAIQMIIVIAFLMYYMSRGAVSPHFEAWPLIIIVLLHIGAMGMGCGIIISSMTTKYRDLAVLVSFGIQLWMYITPIVYPLSQVGEGKMRLLLLLNPVTAPVEVFRYAVLGQGIFEPLFLTWSWAFTIIVTVLGIMIFNKVEKTFMDTV